MLLNYGYALGVLVVQLTISLAYQVIGFIHALEVFGGILLMNAIGFSIHACLSRQTKREKS